MAEETFNLRQLTKEMISKKLEEIEDPIEAAAGIVEKALYAALKDAAEFKRHESLIVQEACHGALTAMVLKDQNLSRGAVRILKAVTMAAGRLNLDTTDMIKQALIGLARIRKVTTRQQLYEIGNAIQSEFMGAGDFFRAEISLEPTEPIEPLRPLNTKAPKPWVV